MIRVTWCARASCIHGNFCFQGLTDGQIGILKNYGYWDHIVANNEDRKLIERRNLLSVAYTSLISN